MTNLRNKVPQVAIEVLHKSDQTTAHHLECDEPCCCNDSDDDEGEEEAFGQIYAAVEEGSDEVGHEGDRP